MDNLVLNKNSIQIHYAPRWIVSKNNWKGIVGMRSISGEYLPEELLNQIRDFIANAEGDILHENQDE